MITKDKAKDLRKEERWYGVQITRHVYENNNKFDETFTDFVQAESVSDVYNQFSEVDVTFTIIDIWPVTAKQVEYVRKQNHKPWFCKTTGESVYTLTGVIRYTWEVFLLTGRICTWSYLPLGL